VSEARVSAQDVADAAGVTPQTVRRWARAGLLPPPKVNYGVKPGRHSYWEPHAPAQARWITAQISAGLTFAQIKAALEAGEFTAEKTGLPRET
jgi:DNA-binding transcriptional MerR regulator